MPRRYVITRWETATGRDQPTSCNYPATLGPDCKFPVITLGSGAFSVEFVRFSL